MCCDNRGREGADCSSKCGSDAFEWGPGASSQEGEMTKRFGAVTIGYYRLRMHGGSWGKGRSGLAHGKAG